MGILNRIALENQRRPRALLSLDKALERLIIDIYGGGLTASGVSVNSDTAMRLITVHSCVKVLSQTISQLPCHVMEMDGRMTQKAKDFYLYELLHDQPNSWMTAAEFWGMSEAHIASRGNFYAYKSGLPGRPIKELIPLAAGAVQQVVQNPDYSLTYQVLVEEGRVVNAALEDGFVTKTGSKILNFPGEKIMHLRGLVLNGFMGINPIQYVRETMGLALAGEQFLARFFGSGMHPGAVIKHPLSLNTLAHADLKKKLQEKYQGLGKSHEFMLIDEGMDITFPPIKLVDAQFLEWGKFTDAQICGLFRVPLMLIQSAEQPPTNASAEQFMLSFVVHSLMPILVNAEKAIRRDLMTPEERKRYFVKFSVGGLLRGDFKTRMEGYQTAINTEIMSPNEVRELEDMNPYQGGDEYRTRTSTVKQSGGLPAPGDQGAPK